MQINATIAKQLRQQKSWTQQHLADACGVSLRTIQRLEKEGGISKETLMSLSATLDVPQSQLLELPSDQHERSSARLHTPLLLLVAATGGGVIGTLTMYLLINL